MAAKRGSRAKKTQAKKKRVAIVGGGARKHKDAGKKRNA